MFKTNHIAAEIITNGFISSYPLMGGILSSIKYEIITKSGKHGGGYSYNELREELRRIPHYDIDVINVYVEWFKKPNRDKTITAELLESKIFADIINEFGDDSKSIKINVIKLD